MKMSDKLSEEFDLYYAELRNFTEDFKSRSQAVQTDKLLSSSGKNEQVEKLKAEHFKNVDSLAERFHNDFGKRLVAINDFVNGKKNTAGLDSIKRRFSKGDDISSDESSRLLLHEMQENKLLMKKSNFQNMLSNADEKQVKKTSQTLADNQDVEKLEWLQELTSLKGDSVLSNTIAAQADGIRDSQMSDEQRNLKGVSEKIERGVKLFNYSIERSRTGIFIDARNDEVK